MTTIAEQLTKLSRLKAQLAENLTAKGVMASSSEKLNTLVPKVLEIDTFSGVVVAGMLMDTSENASKSDTLTAYGESLYIYESVDNKLESLTDTVIRWGGVTAQNNYIGDADSKYGVNMANWTQSDCNTGLLFDSKLALNAGKVLVTINANLSNWMNEVLNIRLIAADDLEAAKANILASEFAYTTTFSFAGSTALRDHIVSLETVTAGNYYLYIDGTAKSDNSNFTYNKIEYLNY